MILTAKNGVFVLGDMPCPEWEGAKPAAVIYTERPTFLSAGLGLTIIGFLIQVLAVPGREKSVAANQGSSEINRNGNTQESARSDRVPNARSPDSSSAD